MRDDQSDTPSIADYKMCAHLFNLDHPAIKGKASYENPPRLKQYLKDFLAASANAKILYDHNGDSCYEFLSSKQEAGAKGEPPRFSLRSGLHSGHLGCMSWKNVTWKECDTFFQDISDNLADRWTQEESRGFARGGLVRGDPDRGYVFCFAR